MEGKPVLLDSAALDLIKFAGREEERSYRYAGLNVTPTVTEATNGHIAVRLEHLGMDVEEFPTVEGDCGKAIPAGGMVIKREAVERVAKALPKRSSIPILKMVKVGAFLGGACMVTTDLEAPTVVNTKVEGAAFPNLDMVIPKPDTRPIKVAFQARYLKALAEWAIKHGNSRGGAAVEFEIAAEGQSATNSAGITIKTDDGRKLIAVLMPMRA